MYKTTLQKSFSLLALFFLVTAACDLSVSLGPASQPTPLQAHPTIPPTEGPLPTLAASATPQTSFSGVEVSTGPLHIVIPPGIANGARGNQLPRAEGETVSPWEVTPGHTQLSLEGYVLQGRTQAPRILVYPAQAYAEMYPAAFESMHRLDTIILGDPNQSLNHGELPAIPFFNTQQAFVSHAQSIAFQNGRGVRFLTEYAQYAISANNHDLFYHFQGLTSDGTYYIVAILPIRAPVLAETSDAGAPLPTGGVPYPYFADPQADMPGYYASVTDVLNATPAELFSPSIGQLDLLIQSMRITP